MRKGLWLLLTGCIVLFLLGQPQSMVEYSQSQASDGVVLQLKAKTLQEYFQKYIESRWSGIELRIQFAPDDTALIHAELERRQLFEILVIPDWITSALPEMLAVELQTSPGLNDNEEVVFQAHALSINGMEMPQVICDAVCSGLAYKVNEAFRKEGVCVKSLRIEGEMLKLETKKSSGL